MTYSLNKAPKSVPFVKTFDGTFSGGIGKGTPIEIKRKPYEVGTFVELNLGID